MKREMNYTFSFIIPVLLILHCHIVAGSIVTLLIQTLSKLAFIHDKFVVNTAVLLICQLAAKSILFVGAILTPIYRLCKKKWTIITIL